MQIAERNRAIKKVLEQAFGRGKVRVRGSRGTAYGWVRVDIAYAPRDRAESQELYGKVQQLAAVAAKQSGTALGHYYSDDGTNDTHAEINISFLPCRSPEWHAR